LVVGPGGWELEASIAVAKSRLEAFGFQLCKPTPSSDKAAEGECGPQSINFLGCMLQPKRCVPSAKSVDRLNKDVADLLSGSKAAIINHLRHGKSFPASQAESLVLQTIGKKVYGWQKSFAFCNDTAVFKKVDEDIQKKVIDYRNWITKNLKSAPVQSKMEVYGVPQLALL